MLKNDIPIFYINNRKFHEKKVFPVDNTSNSQFTQVSSFRRNQFYELVKFYDVIIDFRWDRSFQEIQCVDIIVVFSQTRATWHTNYLYPILIPYLHKPIIFQEK